MIKRIISLLAVISLCICLLPAAAFARETDYFDSLPAALDFDALRFDSSCTANTQSVCAAADAMLSRGENPEKLFDMFMQIAALRTEVQTQLSLITILYYGDPACYGDAFSEMRTAAAAAQQKALLTQNALLDDPICGDYIAGHADAALLRAIRMETVPTEQQLAYSERDTALIMEYQSAAVRPISVFAYGQSRTEETALRAYQCGSLSREEYLDTLYQINALRADEIGEIYLQMIPLRNALARSCGYDTYPAYAYDAVFGRDYTPADAAAFRDCVKTYLAPLLKPLYTAVRMGIYADGCTYDGCSESLLLDTIEPYLCDVSDEVAESFSFMRTCDLIDAEYSSTKLPDSFTSLLPGCGVPYILCSRNGGNGDLETVIHEFGHFNSFCYGIQNPCYDTMELHSQGLEALMLHFADSLYGEEARTQTGYALFKFLYLAVIGCCYDELQEYAYSAPSLSADDLNRKSAEILRAYGLTPFGPDGLDYGWALVSHTFESPLYYISYATSAVAAMELYLSSCQNGIAAASDQYLSFVARSASDEGGFRSLMRASGLGDPFDPDYMQSFSARYAACLDKNVYRLPYIDVDGVFSKGDITLLYLLGVMNGTSDTAFSPDASLSRAMAVTVLHRLSGAPKSSTDASSVFSDVASGAWYTDAVSWAVETGITNGTSDTAFSPENTLTCQEFAVMAFRCLYGNDAVYPAGHAPENTAAWAVDAMRWSRSFALFESSRGEILPNDTLSRAELAAALVNLIPS